MSDVCTDWSTTAKTESFWDGIRRQFMSGEDEIYLNTGSFGIMPAPVYERFTESLRELEANPTRVRRAYTLKLDDVRHRLGSFLKVPGEDLSLATNVTTAMNMVILGIDWKPGDEILASDHEYGAINNILDYAARRFGVIINRAPIPRPPADNDEILGAFRSAFTDRTRLIVCSHIATDTGLILPLRAIGSLAHEKGAMIAVDGAHGPGMLPLDLAEMDCDFYGGNCHKWLCAPKGTGFLYVRQDRQRLLNPTQVSWGYQPEGPVVEEGRLTIKNRPAMWELEVVGTRDLACYCAIPEAIAFQEAIGQDRVLARTRLLADYARRALDATGHATLLTPADPGMSGAISAFSLDGLDEADLDSHLYNSHRITVRAEFRGSGHWMRVSTHICNYFEEVDTLVNALRAIWS